MKSTFSILLFISLLFAAGDAYSQGRTPDYKITAVKVVPYDVQTGKFGDPVTAENPGSFFNAIGTSLFVTVEISGQAGSFADGRKYSVTVKEGNKIKLTKTDQVDLIGDEGKIYLPIWLYPAMCDRVTITAKLIGQKTASSMTKKVDFLCGE